ncbi:MAG: hypothetical protein WBD25_08070 [Terriglobales bacterium]
MSFDSQGNLWVTNNGNFTVTEYTGGAQITSSTITNGVLAPQGIAIDGLGNIWVNNDVLLADPNLCCVYTIK